MKQSELFVKSIQMALNTGVSAFDRKTVYRLMRHIEAVEEERDMLLQQIEQEVDRQRPVLLPKDVAKAIECFRDHDTDPVAIYDIALTPDDGNWAACINRWLTGRGGRFLLMQALVNGYTVEEPTLEERIKAGVMKVYDEWLYAPMKPYDELGLAEKVADYVKSVYEEQKQ